MVFLEGNPSLAISSYRAIRSFHTFTSCRTVSGYRAIGSHRMVIAVRLRNRPIALSVKELTKSNHALHMSSLCHAGLRRVLCSWWFYIDGGKNCLSSRRGQGFLSLQKC